MSTLGAGAEGVQAESVPAYRDVKRAALEAESAYKKALRSRNPTVILKAARDWYEKADAWGDAAVKQKPADQKLASDKFLDAMGAKNEAEQAVNASGADSGSEPAPTEGQNGGFSFSAFRQDMGDRWKRWTEKKPATPKPAKAPKGEPVFSRERFDKATAWLKNRGEQTAEKLKKTWGKDTAALISGALMGAAAKNFLYGLGASTGVGYIGSIGFGAAYGAITAATVELIGATYDARKEHAKYDEFVREMREDFDTADSASEINMWVQKVRFLREQIVAESDEARRLELQDKLRYAMLYVKESARQDKMSLKDQAKILADQVLGFENGRGPGSTVEAIRHAAEQKQFLKELKGAHLVDRLARMRKAAIRGAVFGAVSAASLGFIDGSAAETLGSVVESVQGTLTSASEFVGLGDSVDVSPVSEATETLTASELPIEGDVAEGATADASGQAEASASSETAASTEAESATGAEPVAEAGAPTETVVLDLADGSNPWNMVEASLGFDPTNAQMVEIMSRVAEDSGFSVSEWGVTTGPDDQALQAGFDIKISPETQAYINSLRP